MEGNSQRPIQPGEVTGGATAWTAGWHRCHGWVWAGLNPSSSFCQRCSEFTWEHVLPSLSPVLLGGPVTQAWTIGAECPLSHCQQFRNWSVAQNWPRESGPGLSFKLLGKEKQPVLLSRTPRMQAWSCWSHLAPTRSLRTKTPMEEADTWREGRAWWHCLRTWTKTFLIYPRIF